MFPSPGTPNAFPLLLPWLPNFLPWVLLFYIRSSPQSTGDTKGWVERFYPSMLVLSYPETASSVVDIVLLETGLWIQYIFTLKFKMTNDVVIIRGPCSRETIQGQKDPTLGSTRSPSGPRCPGGTTRGRKSKPQRQFYFFHPWGRLRCFTFLSNNYTPLGGLTAVS